jgi:hypothetical protein
MANPAGKPVARFLAFPRRQVVESLSLNWKSKEKQGVARAFNACVRI